MDAGPRLPGTPWTQADLMHLVSALVLAFVGLLIAWIGASGTPYRDPQLAWTAGGIGAVVVAGGGATGWLLTGLRSVHARQRSVCARSSEIAARFDTGDTGDTGDSAPRDPTALVSAPGMTRYHRADCLLVRGKDTTPGSEAAHRRAGRTACGVCAR